ncbi:hypothetical protein H4S01_002321 [Coemansia sp. RSA 2610]|nr:hypothetical protein H4S01_002321 [Coemansia sp. RSA 2610]
MNPTFTEHHANSDAAEPQQDPPQLNFNDFLHQLQYQVASPPSAFVPTLPNFFNFPQQSHPATALPSPPPASNLQFFGSASHGIAGFSSAADMSELLAMGEPQDLSASFRRHSVPDLSQMHLGATAMQGEDVFASGEMLHLGIPNVSWPLQSAVAVTPSLQSDSPSTTVETIGLDTFSVPSPQSVQSPQLGARAQEPCISDAGTSAHDALLGKMLSLAETHASEVSWNPNASAALAHSPSVNPIPQSSSEIAGSEGQGMLLGDSLLAGMLASPDLPPVGCVGAQESSLKPASGTRRRARTSLRATQAASMVFPPEAQRALQQVLYRIQEHPYPDAATIRQIKDEFGLSTKQIRNWFALRRFRHMYWTEHDGVRKWHFRRNPL